MRQLLEDLHQRYPRAVIVGHHDLRSALPLGSSKNPLKACPCIENVAREYADINPK